ncbi:MAG: class I SAM-dependent methyltransferase, partial [Prochlorococcus sp.]
FGDTPEQVRDTDHYQQEYVEEFTDRWDRLIDWKARAEAEGDFYIRILREHGAKSVLDVATGTGFHSVSLLKEAFDVISADGSPNMLARAFQNARDHGQLLRTAQADWRFLNRDIHGEFDAVICLGNSFTHLFRESDRRKSLAEYYAVLKHNGILILDHRNYDRLLDQGVAVRSGKGNVYCGKDVNVSPEHVDEGLARFQYAFSDGSTYHLNMFPLRHGYVRRLMNEVGFQKITSYGDYLPGHHDPDFYVHVAEKEYKFDIDKTAM